MEPEKDIFEQWLEERDGQPWYIKTWNRISNWWSFEARWYPKVFRKGIKNLVYWVPIIWKDRHWDHSYIFAVLQHKLKAQADWIQEHGNHLNAPTDARLMRTCVCLINRVSEGYYSQEYMDYMKNKHWFEEIPGRQDAKEFRSRLVEDRLDQYFAKYPRVYQRALTEGPFHLEPGEVESRREVIAMNIAHLNHERARGLLFRIMEQNIERWWN